MAPSTIGTFLRSFTFGHVRQLEAVVGRCLERVWALGAGPGSEPLVIDIDSTICQVEGKNKHGAGYGYTKVLGYHPVLATRSGTGEILHARMRKGAANTQRGARRFIDELIARVRRAGATGELTVRFDSGFWSNDTIATLNRLNVRYTMAVRTNVKGIAAAIASIPEQAWVEIEYTPDGRAQVGEVAYTTGKGNNAVTRRLIVRRTRLTDTRQLKLWPDWRHHGFLTDLDGTAVDVDLFHRRHAVVELAIRDLKEGAGLDHVPSGNFHANSAWLQCTVLAHNLIRWTSILGNIRIDDQLVVARTIRNQHLALTEPSTSDKLAVGDPIHRSAQLAPPPPPSACLTGIPRSGAPPTEVSADIPNRKPVASTQPNVSPTSHRSTHQARDPHPPRPGADNGSHRCIEV